MQSSWAATVNSSFEGKQESINNSPINSQGEDDAQADLNAQDYVSSQTGFNLQYRQVQDQITNISLSSQIENKSEGYLIQFQNDLISFNQANSESFKEIINEFRARDFSYFNNLWSNTFKVQLEFIIDNWTIFKREYKGHIEIFLKNASQKLRNFDIYEKMYPGLSRLISTLSEKIEYKPKKDLENSQQFKEDSIFFHYLNEQQAKAQKAGSYFFKIQNEQKQQIGSYIADSKYYQNNLQTWKLFFFIGAALKRYNIDATTQQDIKKQCRKIYKFAELLLKNYQLTQSAKRICCSKFFYMNFNICPLESSNIICRPRNDLLKNRVHKLYEKQEKETKNIKMDQKLNIEEFNRQMKDLMLDIVGLLNSGGGVVLLYAKRHYLETWVQGESIVQQKKKIYLKLLKEGLEAIRPAVRMEQEITLKFVPIVKNPYEYDYLTDLDDQKERSVNRNYIQGLYCPRITVVPSEAERLYYYHNNKQEAFSAIIEKNERLTLKGEQMVILMKKKFENFYVSEADAEDQECLELLSKDFLSIEKHICQQPYVGYVMHIQQQRQLPKPVKQFKYMSMLVAHKSNHSDIQRKLNSKGFECLIPDIFHSFNLKSSNSSAPLYHNIRFDQIFNEINHNKEFQYNGRYVLIIAVTTYIKLINRTKGEPLHKANLDNLLGYIKKLFPSNIQGVSLYSFINEEGQYEQYIRATTKESNLLIYYLLHNSGEKCIFKNPKSLEKIPEAQRAVRWKLIYQVGASNK